MINEWLDDNGYPTSDALARITNAKSPREGLDATRDAWNEAYGSVWDSLRESEAAMLVRAFGAPQKFLRFTTGGWSGNEDAIEALLRNALASSTWKLRRAGGLHIFEYPPEEAS